MLPPLREDDTLPLPPGSKRGGLRFKGGAARFVLLDEIAHGGMGVVYRVHDPDLDRSLALKLLQEQHRDNHEMIRRFLEEARIAGRLQHPGIVPIHEIGYFSDGRPFFTMKLVEGRTLAALLAERQSLDDDLPRFIAIFEQVCHTMAYTHASHVVHRDLKPANIMVGTFGEVQVMDWGLAKLREEVENVTDTPISHPAITGPPDHTVAGTIIGTPAYMAPEQARGDLIDERADVFGLGGILCEILTGQPTYILPRSMSTWLLNKDRDLSDAHARLLACQADPELVALARDCLAENPAHRPRHAGEVTQRLNAYQSSVAARLHQAEVDRAAAEARVEAARARSRAGRLLLFMIVGVLVLLCGLTAAAWFVHSRQQNLRYHVELLLAQVDAYQQDAERRAGGPDALAVWHDALASIDKSDEALGTFWGTEQLRFSITARRANIVRRIAQLEFEKRFVTKLHDSRLLKDDALQQDSDMLYSRVFREAQLDLDNQTPEEVVAVLRDWSPHAIREIVIALDNWTEDRRLLNPSPAFWAPLMRLASRLDDDPWRIEVRSQTLLASETFLRPEALAADSLHRLLCPAALPLHLLLRGIDQLEQRRALLALVRSANLQDLEPASVSLVASLLRQLGEDQEAIDLLRGAQRLHPRDLWLNYQLANALYAYSDQRLDESIQYYTAVRAIRPEIGHSLAHALEKRHRFVEAIEIFKEVIRLRPDQAQNHRCLGQLYARIHHLEDAEIAFKRVLELEPTQALAHSQLANVYARMKRYDLAEPLLREALRINPNFIAARLDLIRLLSVTKRFEELKTFLNAQLASGERDAQIHFHLALVHEEEGQSDRAIESYRRALALNAELPEAHNNLALILIKRKQFREAEQHLREALQLRSNLLQARRAYAELLSSQKRYEESHVQWRTLALNHADQSSAYLGLAEVELQLGRLDDCIRTCTVGLNRFPRDSVLAYNLAIVLSSAGKHDEAIAAYRRSLALRPDYPEAHCNLGLRLRERGEFAAALAHLEKGHELGSTRQGWTYPSAAWIADVQALLAMENRLPSLLDQPLDSFNNVELLLAARVCYLTQRFAAAVRCYLKILERQPEVAGFATHFNREKAAEAALAAVSGLGHDADSLSDQDKRAFRRLALTWMSAELDRYRRIAANRPLPVRRHLLAWERNERLAIVRQPQSLARLGSEERRVWTQFWNAVAVLTRPSPPEPRAPRNTTSRP